MVFRIKHHGRVGFLYYCLAGILVTGEHLFPIIFIVSEPVSVLHQALLHPLHALEHVHHLVLTATVGDEVHHVVLLECCVRYVGALDSAALELNEENITPTTKRTHPRKKL